MRKSNISWTDSSWNPWFGCVKISEGCKNCYLHRIYLEGAETIRKTKTMQSPYKWKEGRKIFTCSMSDFFIENADEWRNEAWEVIKNTQQHTYLILTKRPERIKECLPDDWCKDNYSNVWLGVTVENQKSIHKIHQLGEIPCQLRWVSFEPLLDEVYLTEKELSIIDWAILGGESGNETGKYRYRKTELSWFLSLMYQLKSSNTPIFFKQFGTWYHKNKFYLKDWKGEKPCVNFPLSFLIRQYPKTINNES